MNENKKVYHLTLTGFNAGLPLCGCNKEEERAKGNDFWHYMYANLNHPQICPNCKKIADEVESED